MKEFIDILKLQINGKLCFFTTTTTDGTAGINNNTYKFMNNSVIIHG